MLASVARVTAAAPSTPVLVISVLGLVLAVASLVWQFATFRLNGPRIRTTLRVGTAGAGLTLAPVRTGWQRVLAQLVDQGAGEPVVAVEVRNVGRSAATVVGFQAQLDNGMSFLPTSPPAGGTTLPHRLEAEDQVTFWMPYKTCVNLMNASRRTSRPGRALQMQVQFGSGRTVDTKERLAARDLLG